MSVKFTPEHSTDNEILLSIKRHQQLFVDPKRIRLLQEIAQCGSINQAAKNAKVSYKSAWDHLQAMNDISPKPLLERNTGGKNGGGTQLTQYAIRLLQLYELLIQTQQKAFEILQDESIPLTNILNATARFSLQSSARNQLFGKVKIIEQHNAQTLIGIDIAGLSQLIYATITQKSAVRLQLILNKEIMLMFKAPWLKLSTQQPTPLTRKNSFKGQISAITTQGTHQEIVVQVGNDIEFCALVNKPNDFQLNQVVWTYIEPESIILAGLL
ncbi:molybdate transport system regulatory protein [Volucribacter psittacicida]|uniref:Molybdate transport system regulatory protein n=1 Tax=Volucribacter psittacicida TaxID=203482 RepID=A0A4R1G871_9PAST|nr:TOBE domain-containing protein [Volucribacter psittacicida]TCK01909.1 molybdate transport system regulatory protein [Volucribacter psittacicida]